MAGYAGPLAVLEDPGIGKTSEMVVRFAVVGAFGVIDTGHDPGIAIQIHLQALDGHQGGLELWIFDIGQKLAPLADLAVPLRIDEAVGDHAFKDALIAAHLGIVPKMLEHNQFGGLRVIVIASNLPRRPQRQ